MASRTRRETTGKSRIPVAHGSEKPDANADKKAVKFAMRSSRPAPGKKTAPTRQADVRSAINAFIKKRVKSSPLPGKGSLNVQHYKAGATHLCQMVDPNFRGFSSEKFHIEFRELMEIMGYPYAIRPADLQSFGAVNRVAPALDPLYWMICLLRENEDTREAGEKGRSDIVEYRLMFFNFLRKAYASWLAEGDKPLERFDQELAEFVSRDARGIEQIHSALEQKLSEKRRVLESLENLEDPRIGLDLDVKQGETRVIECEELLQREQQALAGDLAELDRLKSESDATNAKREELRLNLAASRAEFARKGINATQLESILKQTSEIEDHTKVLQQAKGRAEETLERATKMVAERSAAIANIVEELNKAFADIRIPHRLSGDLEGGTMRQDVEELIKLIGERKPSDSKDEPGKNRISEEANRLKHEKQVLEREEASLRNDMKAVKSLGVKDAIQLKRKLDQLVEETKQKQREMEVERKDAEQKLKDLEDYFAKYKAHVNEQLRKLASEVRNLDELCKI
jgi:predicted  nucleic acid-binding Zn-ribbon protein